MVTPSKTSYHTFAYYYNQLIDYDFYLDYVNNINKLGVFDNILDLACGSGSLAFLLKRMDNQVTGLDSSLEMLMIAEDINKQEKKGVSFINQDLRDLDLYDNSYDLVTCTLDSLNYVESEYLDKIFSNIYNSLQEDGIFCFDVLTQFYIDEVVNDYYQCEEVNDFEYVWQVNKIDDNIIRHQLQILADDNTYEEIHWQFIHSQKLIEDLIKNNKFMIIDRREVFNELNSNMPSRLIYTIKKVD